MEQNPGLETHPKASAADATVTSCCPSHTCTPSRWHLLLLGQSARDRDLARPRPRVSQGQRLCLIYLWVPFCFTHRKS